MYADYESLGLNKQGYASNLDRQKAREIVGDKEYIQYQTILIQSFLKENSNKTAEDWITDGWSELYVKAILDPAFKTNKRINGNLHSLSFGDLKHYMVHGHLPE